MMKLYHVFAVMCVYVCATVVTNGQLAPIPNCNPAGYDPALVYEPGVDRFDPPTQTRSDGRLLTSHGYVKVIAVFVNFEDDEYEPNNTDWPTQPPLNCVGCEPELPIWVRQPGMLFTPVSAFGQTPFNPLVNSVSDYFWQMSRRDANNGLRVYGDCYYVKFPHTRQEVIASQMSVNAATVEIIERLDQVNGVDFSIYDRWSTRNLQQHQYQPNGVVDLVLVFWRNVTRDLPALDPMIDQLNALGYARASRYHLTAGATIGMAEAPQFIPVDNGQRSVFTGFVPLPFGAPGEYREIGAGITMVDWLEQVRPIRPSTGVPWGRFRELIHEFGHVLCGSHRESGPWSILSHSDCRGYGMSAAEMIYLGWANPRVVRKGDVLNESIQLGDLYTTGECIAVEIDRMANPRSAMSEPDGGNKWYLIENHQMLSPYDFGTSYDDNRQQSKGIYVLYEEDHCCPIRRRHIQSSSGEFTWSSVQNYPYQAGWLPSFERLVGVRSGGATQSEYLPVVPPRLIFADGAMRVASASPMYSEWIDGQATWNPQFLGIGGNDHHTACIKPVWSPWSSPSSDFSRQGSLTQPFETGVSISISSIDVNGTATLNVATDNVPIGPPSELLNLEYPSSVTVVPDGINPVDYSALFTWSASIEPDIAGYRVYRRPGVNTNGWELLETLSSSTLSFQDDESTYPFSMLPHLNYLLSVQYKVKAYDTEGLESNDCLTQTVAVAYATSPCCYPYMELNSIDVVEQPKGIAFPNPATSTITLAPSFVNQFAGGQVEVVVSKASGETVYCEEFEWDYRRERVLLFIEHLVPGAYYASLKSDKATAHFSFVKQ